MVGRGEDWFLPAVKSASTVESGLEAVARAQEARLFFVQELKRVLVSPDKNYSDGISALRGDLSFVQKTLDFRLGILQKSRPQAWFRAITAAELGPFPAKINFAPVLPQVPTYQARRFRNEIALLWQARQASSGYLPLGGYLWSDLLQLNARWDQMCQLQEPYGDLRLDELPEGLPDDLATKSLSAYLSKVRGLISLARQELDQCFQVFFQVTERFLLDFYEPSFGEQRAAPPRQGGSLAKLADSLEFMKFNDLPSLKELKKRYFELAKICHPDSAVGSSERFRSLRVHYEKILREVRGP